MIGDPGVEGICENRMMSKIRIGNNEWDYGVTGDLFPFAKDKSSC